MYPSKEDREAREAIARLDERINLEPIHLDDKLTTVIHKGYELTYLFDIEAFVKSIETGWKGGFAEQVSRYSKITKIRALYLGKKYYGRMNMWLDRYSDLYRYSARVEVFYEVCKELRLLSPAPFYLGEPEAVCGADGMRYMDLFNALIERVRERCQSREFTERERLRLINAKRNEQRVLAREQAMFSRDRGRSRWLVLSLTLGYKAKFRRWITPDVIQRHRRRFFAARRFNTLMSGIKFYVSTIEQGQTAGLHLHVILFYSPDHNRDEFIAQQIGEYWANVVTRDRGEYRNSNAGRLKKGYEKKHGIGVGQINWNNVAKRRALRVNLAYLAKAEQYLMVKGSDHIRTFDMGHMPVRVKAGRPRTVSAAGNATESTIRPAAHKKRLRSRR